MRVRPGVDGGPRKAYDSAVFRAGRECRSDVRARVRWSDAGLAAVQGGRFRLMSPVFPPPSQCEDLGDGKIRPVVLVSVALTNEPNIKGGRPIANRKAEVRGRRSEDGGGKKYRWVLGNPPSGDHCEVCLARAGKIKTGPQWAAMGMPPCNCHCTLEPVDEETENRWSDIARAASLAVRQAKAERRKAEGGRMKAEGETVEVSRQDAKAQRLAAAREAVRLELAKKRSAAK